MLAVRSTSGRRVKLVVWDASHSGQFGTPLCWHASLRGPTVIARDVHNLAVSWIGALVVLAAMAGASCWLSLRSLNDSNDSALLVAVTRQQMLSQRLALLAHQYAAADDEFVRLDLRWELRASADQLIDILEQHMQPGRAWKSTRPGAQRVEESPLSDRPLSAAVMALYNEPPMLLKYHLTELAAGARQLASQQTTEVASELALAGTVQARAMALLRGMDALVSQLLQEHEAGIEAQRSLQYRLAASMLAALLVVALMLGIPGLRLARAAGSQRSATEAADRQSASNQPAAITPASPARSTSGPKTA